MKISNIQTYGLYNSNTKSNINDKNTTLIANLVKKPVEKPLNYSDISYLKFSYIPFEGRQYLRSGDSNSLFAEVEKLSDEDFKALKSKFDKKFKKYDLDVELDRNNILLADKIFSEKLLYNNEDFIADCEQLLSDVWNIEGCKAKYDTLDKVIKSKKFIQNGVFVSNYLSETLSSVFDSNTSNAKCILIDKINSSPMFSEYDYDDSMDTDVSELVCYVKDTEEAKVKAEVIDKINANPGLLENDIFKCSASAIISGAKSMYSLPFIDKILSEPNLYNNKLFLDNAGSIISDIDSDSKCLLADKMFSNKECIDNESFYTCANYTLSSLKNDEQLKIKCDLIDRIVSDKLLLGTSIIKEKLGSIINTVNNISQYEFLKKILSDPKIYNNRNVISSICDILGGIQKTSDVLIKSNVIDKILSNERLCSNHFVMSRLGAIISSVMTEENAKAKCDFIDKIFTDEKFFANENLDEYLGNIIQNTQNSINIKLLDLILADEKLYKNKNLIYNLPDIFSRMRTEDNYLLAKRILSDKKLSNNKNVLLYLDNIISCQDKSEFYNRLNVINFIESLPEFLSMKNVKNNLGMIIDNITPEKYDFFTYLAQDNDILQCAKQEETKNCCCLIEEILCNCSPNDSFEDYQKVKQYANLGIKLKDQLKINDEDLKNRDIYKSFLSNYNEILQTEELGGKDTILAAFPLKLDEFEKFLREISDLYSRLNDKDKQLIISKFNPGKNPRINELEKEISLLKKDFVAVQKNDEIKLNKLKQEINIKTHELRQLKHSKVDLNPQTKVDRLLAISSLSKFGVNDLGYYINLIQDDTPENNFEWNKAIEKAIFKRFDIEYDDELSKRLNLVSSKYLDKVLRADDDFLDGLLCLFNLLKANPKKSLTQILNCLSKNIETRHQFEEMGLNYNKWVDFDKNSYVSLNVQLKAQEAKQAAIKNLEADFNDIAYKNLPQEQKQKLNELLNKEGVTLKLKKEILYDAVGLSCGEKEVLKLYEGDTPVSFKTLHKVISTLKNGMNSDDFWSKEHKNCELDNAVKTFYNHITKLRHADIKRAQDIKSDSEAKLIIRKTNMNDIAHSLFLGNQASCCTAVGTGCNQYSATSYVMSKAISAIEVVDGNNFVGNSMCYIAEVDGVPSLVLDNIEMNTKYQYNDKIRDAFFEYAKKLTKEIGAPDMPIYAGPERHKFNMNIYPRAEHYVKIKGSTGDDLVYIDYATQEYQIDNNRIDMVSLFKIR